MPQAGERAREHDLVDAELFAEIGQPNGTVEFVEPHHLQHELARCAFGFERFDDPARLRLHFVEQQRFCLTRSEEHTSELQSLMRISYAVFCLTKKTKT